MYYVDMEIDGRLRYARLHINSNLSTSLSESVYDTVVVVGVGAGVARGFIKFRKKYSSVPTVTYTSIEIVNVGTPTIDNLNRTEDGVLFNIFHDNITNKTAYIANIYYTVTE